MSRAERPHYVWIGVIALAAVGLGALAWSLWTGGGGEEPEALPGTAQGAIEGPQADELERVELVQRADALLVEARFEEADELLSKAEALGWSEEIGAARSRLEFHEASYRAEPRAIEIRVASAVAGEDVDELFARIAVNGVTVFETESFAPLDPGAAARRECLVTVRSSFDEGATVELLAPGGLIAGPKSLLGPARIAPLARLAGGSFEFKDPDSSLREVSIAYRASPHLPGLWPDDVPERVPADAPPAEIARAAQRAIEADQMAAATQLVARLEREAPEHPDLPFTTRRMASRAEFLEQNRTRVRLVVLEAAADPAEDGDLWASGGDAPSFRVAIVSGKRTLGRSSGGKTAPFLVPGSDLDPPAGNVIEFMERGDLPLTLVLFDTSPTFGSTEVGSVELGITLADLPRGSGTLVVERETAVLVLPEGDTNRLRRVVLRWSVSR